jgi:hypothetical protein
VTVKAFLISLVIFVSLSAVLVTVISIQGCTISKLKHKDNEISITKIKDWIQSDEELQREYEEYIEEGRSLDSPDDILEFLYNLPDL